jgi:pyruvate kinase
MKIKSQKIRALIDQLEAMITLILEAEKQEQDKIDQVNPIYRKSARNLVHYRAFRTIDLREIQQRLGHLGLSQLTNIEGHVLSSLIYTKKILLRLIKAKSQKVRKSGLSIKNGKRLLIANTKSVVGYRSKGRRVRIMVTQPRAAAFDYQMVYDMIKNGMNCARINCAHDDEDIWLTIIKHIKKASKKLSRKVKITMDLGGPKIRTGPIQAGPKIRKFTPQKDDAGKIVNPALIYAIDEINEDSLPNTISIDAEQRRRLKVGDRLTTIDTRDKHRTLKVIAVEPDYALLHCFETTYLGTGTNLQFEDEHQPAIIIGELPALEQSLILREGDALILFKEMKLGQPAVFNEDGELIEGAYISCETPEVFGQVKKGERILFDDGKIEAVIKSTDQDHFLVNITRAKEGGSKLKAEKGINFPNSNLNISGLTEKDKLDLAFIAKHADAVSFSFVNTPADVDELIQLLDQHGVKNKLNIILKIETQKAYDNLNSIILAAMKVHHIGVMIARGDLAVETGWDHIGLIQQEMVTLCGSAHVPVIWATQVLEHLAKKGVPSRAEITDASASIKAECVMLNKGPYINDAIQLLDGIFKDLEGYYDKNLTLLPQLTQR